MYEISWVDRSHRGGVQCVGIITLACLIFELVPFVVFHTWILSGACPSFTTWGKTGVSFCRSCFHCFLPFQGQRWSCLHLFCRLQMLSILTRSNFCCLGMGLKIYLYAFTIIWGKMFLSCDDIIYLIVFCLTSEPQSTSLTHSHTITPFDAPGKQAFWKHFGKRRNCS